MGLHLLAVDALLGELLLIAGQAVVVGVLQHEAPGANGLLAAVAGEAVLVPTVASVLHLFGAWWVEEAGTVREKRCTKNIFENAESQVVKIPDANRLALYLA